MEISHDTQENQWQGDVGTSDLCIAILLLSYRTALTPWSVQARFQGSNFLPPKNIYISPKILNDDFLSARPLFSCSFADIQHRLPRGVVGQGGTVLLYFAWVVFCDFASGFRFNQTVYSKHFALLSDHARKKKECFVQIKGTGRAKSVAHRCFELSHRPALTESGGKKTQSACLLRGHCLDGDRLHVQHVRYRYRWGRFYIHTCTTVCLCAHGRNLALLSCGRCWSGM